MFATTIVMLSVLKSRAFYPVPPPPDLRVLIDQGNIAPQLTHAPDTEGWVLERLDPTGWTTIQGRSKPNSVPGEFYIAYQGLGNPGQVYQYRASYLYYNDFWGLELGPYAYGTIVYSGTPQRPPYSASCPRTSPCGPHEPERGGLRNPAGPEGRKADPVNLASGMESYEPEPDLEIYNPVGPQVSFQRAWRQTSAMGGALPNGFVWGWTHNYDIEAFIPAGYGWNGFQLIYPGGSVENVAAQTDTNGNPTGQFTEPPGAPYVVTGTPSATPGLWNEIIIRWNDETKWVFNSNNLIGMGRRYKIAQIQNQTGQSLNFTWTNSILSQVRNQANTVLLSCLVDPYDRLIRIEDAYGRKVNFDQSQQPNSNISNLRSVSNPYTGTAPVNGTKVSYTYGLQLAVPLLKQITTPSPSGTGNSTTTINYDPVNLKVTSVVDANGNREVYTYNATSTLVDTQDPNGASVFYYTQKFDAEKRNSGIMDANGYETFIAYNDGNNPTRATETTDRENRVTAVTYDSFGNVTSVTTPRGLVTTNTYDYTQDPTGRLLTSQEGSKTPTSITYFANGLVQSVSTPTPGQTTGTVTTSFTYDALGNVLTRTTPGNNATATRTVTFDYTTDGTYTQTAKVGQPVRITDESGFFTRARYDAEGRQTDAWDENGILTQTAYNLVGDVTQVTLPATGQSGPGQGRLVTTYRWLGGPVHQELVYNESSTLIRTTTTNLGHEYEFLSVNGASENYSNTYDAAYRTKTLVDGNGNTTTYNYDPVGRVSSTVFPGNETMVTSSYSPEGNLLQRIAPNAKITDYTYSDPEGLITNINYQSEPGNAAVFTYDSYGRVATRTDGSGAFSWTYGRNDEVLTETTTYTGLAARTLTRTYYPDGSASGLQSPFGNFTYNYTANGRPSSMTNPNAQTTSWTYENNGRLQVQTLSNTAKTTYGYNALDQLTSIVNATNANVSRTTLNAMTYDGAGNRTGHTVTNAALSTYSGASTHGFDTQDRITGFTSARAGSLNHSFVSDGAGNLTTIRGQARTHNIKNQITGTGYSYDFSGNPTTYKGVTCTYDAENRLTAYGTNFTAGYRADSMMAWSQTGTTRTYYLYDGRIPVFELNSTGALAAINSFGANGLVSRRVGTTTTWYFFDERGNTLQRINSSQGVISNHDTDAFGTTTTNVAVTDPWRGFGAQFGYIWFSGPSLYLCTLRFYDPANGRFLTRDPIGYQGGINLYAYCANNPLMMIDPWGTECGVLSALLDPQVWKKGLGTSFAALGSNLSLGLYDGGQWKNEPGFGESRAAWMIAELAITAGTSAGKNMGGRAVIAAGQHSVYYAYKGRELVYVGRSVNVARRMAEHGKRFDGVKVIAKNLSKDQARALEQAAIEKYGMKKIGGVLQNKRNEISKASQLYSKVNSMRKYVK